MEKKGQASMEFLMTYGWAILAAVLAIGVLAYYGVFSPGKSLPNICAINAPLGCDEYQVNSTGAIIIVRNGAGDSITVNSFTLTGCTANVVLTAIADGATASYYLPCAGLSTGQKFSGDIVISYMRSGKTLNETSTGDIRAEVR
jgi:uncharacterized protein (UPF0333 family)